MYYTYMLKSKNNNWFYVGITNNLTKRLLQHNKKQVTSTKNKAPFKLMYYKKFNLRKQARDYEKFLKVSSNKEKLIKQLIV